MLNSACPKTSRAFSGAMEDDIKAVFVYFLSGSGQLLAGPYFGSMLAAGRSWRAWDRFPGWGLGSFPWGGVGLGYRVLARPTTRLWCPGQTNYSAEPLPNPPFFLSAALLWRASSPTLLSLGALLSSLPNHYPPLPDGGLGMVSRPLTRPTTRLLSRPDQLLGFASNVAGVGCTKHEDMIDKIPWGRDRSDFGSGSA